MIFWHLVTHMLDFGTTPQETVEAPRWRSLQNPMESNVPHTCEDVLQVEGRFPEEMHKSLAQKGHDPQILEDWDDPGNAQAVQIKAETGVLMGGSDPRRDKYAEAY